LQTGTLDFPKFLKVMSRTARPTESLTDQDDLMAEAFSFFAEQVRNRLSPPS
jgi:Ca2+-binding EF-hand superfamily protein